MERRIWSLWWQGEENAPLPVKLCFASIRRHANGAEVVVLDKDTYERYVSLPRHILDRFNRGQISITHLSDVLRLYLLRDYGGLWIDSTIFLKEDISDEVFKMDFYSLRQNGIPEEGEASITNGRWATFLIGGNSNCTLFNSLCEMYYNYWRDHAIIIDYFLFDYLIKLCFDHSEYIQKLILEVPLCGGKLGDFRTRRNQNICLESIDGDYQKLSWKIMYCTRAGGGNTLFGNALKEYDFSGEDKIFPPIKIGWKHKLERLLTLVPNFFKQLSIFGIHVALWEMLGDLTKPLLRKTNLPDIVRRKAFKANVNRNKAIMKYLEKQVYTNKLDISSPTQKEYHSF